MTTVNNDLLYVFTGIRAELTYLGKLLENLGITAEFVAIGAFKSAPETFTEGWIALSGMNPRGASCAIVSAGPA